MAQNGATTKLLHNTGARPGLRVRLAGPPGNPQGIGAVLRLKSGSRLGPAREIHAGSGYWSQDEAIQVLGWPDGGSPENSVPAQISVRWPGGQTTTVVVPPNSLEISLTNALAK